MIVGTHKLLSLVKNPEFHLIKGLSKRELTNPEGEGLELRVGEIYEIVGNKAFLGTETRSTPETRLIAAYKPDIKDVEQETVIILPGEYRLVKTIEEVNPPEDLKEAFQIALSVTCHPRTTFQRSGVELITSNISPGYSGQLTFGLANRGPCNFELQLGARICRAVFHETTANISGYRGQWNGGKVSTEGIEEKQV